VIAHLLTSTRLLLVVPFALWMLRDDATARWLAAAALVVAIVTDLLDGPAARRSGGGGSAAGRAFDHGTDFLFVSAGLFAMAARGAATWWLPVLVCVAFSQYVIDSYVLRRERQLRMSQLGRWNGILYFVPLCADVVSRSAAGALHAPIAWLGWALAASTLLSIGDRLLSLKPGRAAPGSRA
jgi:phosphatidylglycerophosphate synthase